jgi:hypothetical protein
MKLDQIKIFYFDLIRIKVLIQRSEHRQSQFFPRQKSMVFNQSTLHFQQ